MNIKKNYSGTLNVQIHSADSAFVLFDLGFHVITELVAGASSFSLRFYMHICYISEIHGDGYISVDVYRHLRRLDVQDLTESTYYYVLI